jgi:transcriptional regulator with XRE-family HTH domain
MSAEIRIGKLIKKVRKESHMTQEELAEKSNLSVNFISRMERTANQNVSFKNIESMAKALGISIMDLVRIEDSETEQHGLYLTKLLGILEGMDQLKAEELCKNIIDIIKVLDREEA